MPAATRPGLDASPLRQRLAALRRRLYLVATVRGAGWLLTVLVATAVVAGVLDWRWHLPGTVRAVFLVAALAGAAVVAVRYLLRPLSARSDDLALALRVEERYPSLNDALASTVQFLNQPGENNNDSASMRREAVRRALGLMHGLDFNRVVDARGLLSASLAVTGTCALALLFLWIDPALAKTALVRLANPFGTRDWPHLTQLDALEARYKTAGSGAFTDWQPLNAEPIRVGKNYEFQLQGAVKGRVIPDKVIVVFRAGNFPPSEHTCDVTFDEATKTHRFGTRLKPDQVQQTFKFQVRANDDTSSEFEVKVLPPPQLAKSSPQLTLHYPAYTGLGSPKALDAGTANVDAVFGTAVTLRAKVDRPLKAAWIEPEPEDKTVTFDALIGPLGAAVGGHARKAGALAGWERVEVTLDPKDRSLLRAEFLPRVSGSYWLHFEDETGLRGNKRLEVKLHADPTPTVQLERPSPARDVLHVLPDAELPLYVLADDQVFALRSVFVYYRTMRADPPRKLVLYDHAAFAADCVAPLTGAGVRAAKGVKLRPTNLEFRRTLALRTIRHSNGWSLREGDVVILQAGADDFDDVTPGKQPGLSHEVEIHVVSRNALEVELNSEQAKVQQELLRLREKEREALKLVTEVENKLKKGEKLTEDDFAKLLQAEQTQQQLHERVGDDQQGLRAEVARVLQTLKQNQLQNSAVKERMQDVQRELDRLAANELEPIEQRLAQARKEAELNDEKSRAENKAAREKLAKELTDKANASKAAADKKAEQAFQDEAKADRLPDGDAEKDRLNDEAKKLRKEAAELQKQVEQLKKQAERARTDAESGNLSQPREQLAEARQHQEEVEKTLNDLLTRLEPWSSTREIKGEANKLLDEQRKLAAELEELKKQEKDILGKGFDELTPRQREELAELRDKQQRIEERTNQLLEKMNRVSRERLDKDPETAQELRDAREQAKQDNITGQMKDAKDDIKNNRIQDAQRNQADAIKGLEKMVKTLKDRREAELDRLVKRMREAEKQLDELIDEQERLQKKVQEAQKLEDPKEREEALKRLAKQQAELQQKAQDLMKQLSRLRAERASGALGKAGGEMEQAGGELSRGRQGNDKQEDALERLDEAQRELEQARQQAEDQLRREQLARVEETIKALRDRQEGLNKEAVRIQKEIQQKAEWSRTLGGELSRLAENELGLGTEAVEVAKKDLPGTPVFAKLVERVAKIMEEASDRAQTVRKEKPPFDKLPDAELTRLQNEALRRLGQMLDAVKAETAALNQNAAAGGGGNGGGGEGGAGANGLPPLAQLKLLRAMQEDVNKRTEAFRKAHPDLDNLTEKEKTELATIRRDQQDIAGLLEELRGDNPGGPEGDKK
jgi:hypothetical protein